MGVKTLTTIEVLGRLGSGGTLEEFGHQIAKASVAAVETGKNASVTLKIVFAPMKKGPKHAANVSSQVTSAIPRHDLEDKVFFATQDGLTLDDPMQLSMKEMENNGA